MIHIIPKDINTKQNIYRGISIIDVIIALSALLLLTLIISSNLTFKFLLITGVLIIYIPLYIRCGKDRVYMLIFGTIRHFISQKRYYKLKKRNNYSSLITYDINQDHIENQDRTVSQVVHICAPYMALKSEQDKEMYSFALTRILNSLDYGDEIKLIKLEQYLDLYTNIKAEKDRAYSLISDAEKNIISDEEYYSRLKVIETRFNKFLNIQDLYYTFKDYYMLVTTPCLVNTENLCTNIIECFKDVGIKAEIVKDLVSFEYMYHKDMLGGDSLSFNLLGYKLDKQEKSILVCKDYPMSVEDGWARDIMDIKNTKVVLSFKRADEKQVIKKIDNTLLTLGGEQESAKASISQDRENQIETLENMLNSISQGGEGAISTSIYVFLDSKNKKEIKRKLNKDGFVFTEDIAKIKDSYISCLIGNIKTKEKRRIMPCSVAGASFPLDSNLIQDPKGIEIGENTNPVYKDFFILDENHLNSNMVVLGKSGAGKSYFVKNLLSNFAAMDTKIFILDPEGEYKELTNNFGGEIIDTACGDNGRINPFDIEKEEDKDSQLRFLDEMYKTIFAGIETEAIHILNEETAYMYKYTYSPTFNTLYTRITNRLNKETDLNQIGILKSLLNHMEIVTKGLANKLWNGETNINTKSRIVDIDFSKLILDGNHEVTNAEMLIVLHYLLQTLSKNTYSTSKVIVVIDEAHLFVDGAYSAALDFMYQLAKRIRKYNGMQIVITQNIKDFVGSQEIIKKTSAVINASQYSVLFNLSPQDITDLIKLYENAGGFSEYEKSLITYAQRGEALMLVSPSERITFKVTKLEE